MTVVSLLARQAGVLSRDQALRAGLPPAAVDHLVRRRRWTSLHPQVYLAAGHRHGDEAAVRAAVLWAGDDAVLTGRAAAWWHGIVDDPPPAVRVAVPPHRTPRSRPTVDVRRRALHPDDVTVLRGLRITAEPLTVLDTAVELGDGFLDHALQRVVRFPAVHAAQCRNPGSARAGQLLAAAADRSAPVAEDLLLRVLRASGTTGWRAVPAAGVVFPEARVAVAVDGWAWRADPGAGERRSDALAPGWTLLRWTFHDLVERPGTVLAGIAAAVGGVRHVDPALTMT
ncbi:type IV toxin-antitoxin system AbiEi family antitoxin domain-containing protein [Pseudonocardia sp. KRD-184]|uniref:Type IV toxin-antitoxin system AbiEi family antitoxin domain-containing protein n=1 Tax=Pseudonocardia oceani TaxID=2792013 RepID=A0ABS6UBX8_9PSEU|nr:type IV toxin-antitoxin system AbiEi family antitoxin domain-containing protein [Pseudonocardia oceani]MBW0093259.1 type IV toxin-antitoxin system AbiEi family antitoxin domain-containing protein [Pseudonocardia oceani]MBW0099996.1 type IV toxin-antitoxin system AbiEi family antitoxin domain-containing protein [Pseudonocardia oceani]MBW0112657.1 type IV toxin-antitoxin system AbiEi family antitoxin domain-containing protein [Pseudonocardia oceani]MBW0125714.1 type IV toxin-antitoxin system A